MLSDFNGSVPKSMTTFQSPITVSRSSSNSRIKYLILVVIRKLIILPNWFFVAEFVRALGEPGEGENDEDKDDTIDTPL